MLEKLDFLVRFWELKARHASLGEPLSQKEQEELLSLLQLVASDLSLPVLDPRSRVSLVARLAGEGETTHARIQDVTAGGVLVELGQRPVPRGSLILFVADAIRGVEYVLPCSLEWVSARGTLLGLVPSGVPYKNHFDDGDEIEPGEESSVRDRASLLQAAKKGESGAA